MITPIKLSKLIIALVALLSSVAQAVVPEDFEWIEYDTTNGNRIYGRLFKPETEPGKKYPLVVFFQGIAEHGTSNTRSLEKYDGPLAFADKRSQSERPCYVLTISFAAVNTNYGDSAKRVSSYEFLDYLIGSSEYEVDANRLYAIGVSNGAAMGILAEFERSDLFSGAVVVGNAYPGGSVSGASLDEYPIWFHHGDTDSAYKTSLDIYGAMDKAEGVHRYSFYPNKSHLISMNVYNNPLVQSWLFQWGKDETASTAPSNLSSTKTDHEITLTWDAAVDADSTILEYWIYRDGVRIERLTSGTHGVVAPTTYKDKDLLANTSYSYEILAVNAGGKKSVKSSPYSVTTSADTTGANLTRVEQVDGGVRLHFDEPMDEVTAEDVNNYSFASGDTVTKATCYSSGSATFVPAIRNRTTTTQVGRTGRYVRIQLRGKDFLHLGEVEVWNTTTNVNLALSGIATQSSLGTASWSQPASKAIDGNRGGNHANNECFHTNSDDQAWWEVDLGSVQHIDEIQVWNRTDGSTNRLQNFYVMVSDQPFASTRVNNVLAQFEATTVDLEVNTIDLFDLYNLTITGVTDLAGNTLATANSSGRLWPSRLKTVQLDQNTSITGLTNTFLKGDGLYEENDLKQPVSINRPNLSNQGSGQILDFDGVDDFIDASELDFDYKKGSTMVAVVKVSPDGRPMTLFHSGLGRETLNGGNVGYHNLSRDFHDISLGVVDGRWQYSVSGHRTVYTKLVGPAITSEKWQTVVVRQWATSGNTAYTEIIIDSVVVAAGTHKIPDKIYRNRNWLGRDDQAYTSALFKAFKGFIASFSYYNAPIPDTQLGQMLTGINSHYAIDSLTTTPLSAQFSSVWPQYKLDGTEVEGEGLFPYERSNGSAIAFDGEVDLNHLDLKASRESAAVSGMPELSGTSFSVSVWAKSDSATWNTDHALVSRRENFRLKTHSGTTKVSFELLTWSAWHEAIIDVSTLGISIEDWQCYTGVYDEVNKTCKLYVNGKLVHEVAAPNALRGDYGRIYLGRGDDYRSARHLAGDLADFRMYPSALNDKEVYQVFVGEDTDGDGIGDHWERRILASSKTDGIDRLTDVTATSDFDGDGISDLNEFTFGTDATQRDEGTVIKWMKLGANQTSWDICINAKKFRSYFLQASSDVGKTDPWAQVALSGEIQADGDYTFNVPRDANATKKFFRVKVKIE